MPQLRLYLPGAHTNAGRILKNGDRSARCLTIYSADPMGSPSIWCFYAGRGVKETPKPHGPVDKFEGGSRRPRTLIPLHSFSLPPPPRPYAAPVPTRAGGTTKAARQAATASCNASRKAFRGRGCDAGRTCLATSRLNSNARQACEGGHAKSAPISPRHAAALIRPGVGAE